MRLWVLTNGHGEDLAAAAIARHLVATSADLRPVVATLVTTGAEFSRCGIPVGICGDPPRSGGFPAAGVRTFIEDLPAVPGYGTFLGRLRRAATRSDAFLAVGDVFLAGLARLGLGKPGLHVSLPKSVHGRPHSLVECALLKRWTTLVFARDGATAAHLQAKGVRAVFVGNPLVDRVPPATRSQKAALPENGPGPGAVRGLLLPGSRTEAPANLVRLLDVALAVDASVEWHCAWPPAIDVSRALRAATAAGWQVVENGLTREGRAVKVSEGFESLLDEADLVIGLAGTANEQAAASGKPVVTCVGCGPQTTAARMREQERLLGGAAQFVRGDAATVAAAVVRLVRDPDERRRRGALGVARLGPPGGAGRIAEAVVEELLR